MLDDSFFRWALTMLDENSRRSAVVRHALGYAGYGMKAGLGGPTHFMHYDLGYFDLEQKTLQPLDNPFGTRLSPMS